MKKEVFEFETGTKVKELLALIMADIDIFLLQDKDRNDLEKCFSANEIRDQLKNTMNKFRELPFDLEAFVPQCPYKTMGFMLRMSAKKQDNANTAN